MSRDLQLGTVAIDDLKTQERFETDGDPLSKYEQLNLQKYLTVLTWQVDRHEEQLESVSYDPECGINTGVWDWNDTKGRHGSWNQNPIQGWNAVIKQQLLQDQIPIDKDSNWVNWVQTCSMDTNIIPTYSIQLHWED